MAARPKPKLFPHVSEPCAAIFAIKKVEYSGHDRTLFTSDRSKSSHIAGPLAPKSELDHMRNGTRRCERLAGNSSIAAPF